MAMGSTGVSGGQVIRLPGPKPRPGRRLLVDLVRASVRAAVTRPPLVTVVASVMAVAGWLAWWRVGLTWWAALVPVAPLVALAAYAAAQWRRRVATDSWVAIWVVSLATDRRDRDGKVVEAAVLPDSRVVRRPGHRRLVEEVFDEATGQLREVVFWVRPGRRAQTVDHVAKAAGVIAAAYMTRGDCVSVTEAGHKGLAEVRIVPAAWADREAEKRAARVTSLCVWERPSFRADLGTLDLGVVVDTWEPAPLELFTPGWGARRIWMLGESGSGKTYGLDDILLDACTAGIVVPHVIDLEDGPTLAGWERIAASYATTLDGALDVWAALMAEHEARKPILRRLAREEGLDVIPPTPEHPMHLAVIDGGPRAVRHERFMDYTRVAAFEWRKFLMGIVWVSQPGTAEAAFGAAEKGGTSLRDQFGVRIGFRAGREASKAMFGDEKLLPSISTATPGVAFMQSPTFPTPTLIKTKFQHDRAGLRNKWTVLPAWDRPAEAPAAPAWGADQEWSRPAPRRAPDDGAVATVVELPGAGQPGYLRDPDPVARVRHVLADPGVAGLGGMTVKELVAATRIPEKRLYELLPTIPGLTKDRKYGGRWSLDPQEDR